MAKVKGPLKISETSTGKPRKANLEERTVTEELDRANSLRQHTQKLSVLIHSPITTTLGSELLLLLPSYGWANEDRQGINCSRSKISKVDLAPEPMLFCMVAEVLKLFDSGPPHIMKTPGTLFMCITAINDYCNQN
jgi:hypothetical protein